MRSRIALLLLLVLSLCGCLADGPTKIAYNDRPRELRDGWPIGTPESQGIDPAGLRSAYEAFFSENRFVPARSLLVIRNGVLVAEGYCRDLDDIRVKNAIQSATKSVVALAAGIAADRGLVRIDQPIGEYLPQARGLDEARRSITLGHLLTMRSGLYFPNDVFALEMAHEVDGDGLRHILGKPLRHQPGTHWFFQDADPHLASGALAAATGEPLIEFARRELLEPVGITDFVWESDDDGVTWGAYGLHLTPRDFARFGQLVLQKGRWNGVQVVSETFVEEAIHGKVDPREYGLGFGYQWYESEAHHAHFAWGHGGQYVVAVPAKELVIVLTADPDTSGAGVAIEPSELFELIDAIAGAAN